MGKAKKTRKFAVAKKIISPKDARIKSNQKEQKAYDRCFANSVSPDAYAKPVPNADVSDETE